MPSIPESNPSLLSKNQKQRPILGRLGDAGTQHYSGFFMEEPNNEWRDERRVDNVETMRRTDGTVAALLEALKAPILSTSWYIHAEEDVDEKIVDYCNRIMWGMAGRTWFDFLREALTFFDFGHSVFEIVWGIENGQIVVVDLEPRIQRSIYSWQITGKQKGITQRIMNDNSAASTVEIPEEKLLIFTNKKEGDDVTGQSVLRPAWKHFYAKDKLYRIGLIASERYGVGVPVGKLSDNAGDAEKAELESILGNLRSNEKSFMVLRENMQKVEILAQGGSNQSSIIEQQIEHHDKMILRSSLMGFIGLAGGDGGSFALSKDLSSYALQVVEDKARYLAEQFSRQVIERALALAFKDEYKKMKEESKLPYLTFTPLGNIDFAEMSGVFATLKDAGLIQDTPAIKKFVHDTFKLPEYDDEADESIEEEGAQPMEQEGVETPDAEAGTSGDAGADLEKQQADLEAEMDALDAELSEGVLLGVRAPMDEETKKKISEALKKRNGGAEDDPETKVARQRFEAVKGTFDSLKNEVASLRAEGKLNPAKKQEIKAKIAKLKEQMGAAKKVKDALKSDLKAKQLVQRMKKAQASIKAKQEKMAARKAKKQALIEEKRAKIADLEKAASSEKDPEKKKKIEARIQVQKRMIGNAKSTINKIEGDEYELKKKARSLELLNLRVNGKMSEDDLGTIEAFCLAEESEEAEECFDSMRLAEGFVAWRDLTKAESRVKLSAIDDFLTEHQSEVEEAMDSFIWEQEQAFLDKIEKAIVAADVALLMGVGLTGLNQLKADLKEKARRALDVGKSQAAGELEIDTPSTPAVDTKVINAQIDQFVDSYARETEQEAKDLGLNAILTGAGVVAAMAGIKSAFESTVTAKNADIVSTLTNNVFNIGRSVVFDGNKGMIYALQRSEILDSRTCATCLSLDNRIVDPQDPFAKLGQVHSHCRGMWVPIFESDGEAPKITGLPRSIAKNFETTEGIPRVNAFTPMQEVKTPKENRIKDAKNVGALDGNKNMK